MKILRAVILCLLAVAPAIAQLPAPVLDGPPGNGATNVQLPVTLHWNSVVGATRYHLQVTTDQTFSLIIFNDSTITATGKTVPGLSGNTKYHWRVRAKNDTQTSPWSEVWNFTTAAPTGPTLNVTPGQRQVPYIPSLAGFWVSKTGTGSMSWTAQSDQSWATIRTPSGADSGTVYIYCDVNSSTNSRTATITVTASGAQGSPKQVTVVQSGKPATPFWQHTSGPTGGRVSALAMAPQNMLIAGMSWGGLYRSFDKGTTWWYSGLVDSMINAIAVRPTGEIYVGDIAGVAMSTDFGNSWSLFNQGLNIQQNVTAMAVDNVGLAIFAGSQSGIARRPFNASTWTTVNTGLTSLQTNALLAHPTGRVFAGTAGGVYVTLNSGNIWNGPAITSYVTGFATYGAGKIFVGTWNGVYRSIDTGATWSQVNVGLPSATIRAIATTPSGKVFVSVPSAEQPGGVFTMNHDGLSWTSVTHNLAGEEVLALLHVSGDTIAAGTNGNGVFRWVSLGPAWIQSNVGLVASSATCVAFGPGGALLAGTDVGGIFRTTNKGDVWAQVYNGKTDTVSSIYGFTTVSSGLMLCGSNKGVLRSADGIVWTKLPRVGLTENSVFGLVSLDSIPPPNQSPPRVFAATSAGVFVSTNHGNSWSLFNTGLTSTSVQVIARNSAGQIFAGTTNGLFRYDPNAGGGWSEISTGLTTAQEKRINAIACGPGQAAFISTGNVGTGVGIYRSLTVPVSWTRVFSLYPIYALTVKGSSNIFGGSSFGYVYQSTNNGDSWNKAGETLTGDIRALVVGSDAVVYAGSSTSGVYRTYVVTGVDPYSYTVPCDFALLQNYPNPFNPTTVIKFEIPGVRGQGSGVSDVKLAVYDFLGREVAVLVNERKEPGSYEVQFDGVNVSSGVYFYRLTVGSFHQTRKMLLVR